ncbi:MAG: NAD(P)/FAD-dependent oxidoreductase [Actinomycetes bacterium]
MNVVDVLVVGGGPIGLATAIDAHCRGLHVVVVEPRAAPIDKACGEGLMPSALDRLHTLGVDPQGRAFGGIRYLEANGGRQVAASFRKGQGRGVRRTTLHQALGDRASLHGVETVQGRLVGLRQDHADVAVTLASGQILTSRFVVGADGLHSRTRRAAGIEASSGPRPRFGLRRHFQTSPWSSFVDVHWADGVEAYVTPVSDCSVGVALLTERRGHGWDALLERFPPLVERLGSVPTTDPVMGSGPLRQRVTRRVRGRVVLVGDAAGYVDALTGEGIAIGLESARIAVDAIVSEDLTGYEARWRRVTRRSRWLTHAALFAAQHDSVRRSVVPASARWPRAFSMVVNGLA